MLALKILGVKVEAVSSSATALLMKRAPDAKDSASFNLKSGKPVAPRRLQNRLTVGSLTSAALASRAMDNRVVSSGLVRIALATFCSALLKARAGLVRLDNSVCGGVMTGLCNRSGVCFLNLAQKLKLCNRAT